MQPSDHRWAARNRIAFLELLDESGSYLDYLIMHFLAKIELWGTFLREIIGHLIKQKRSFLIQF